MKDTLPGPEEKIRIRFSAKEWTLLMEETFIEDDLTGSAVTEDGNQRVDWSSEDIDEALGYIAEAANHVENKSTVKRLDKLFDKVEKAAETRPGKPRAPRKPLEREALPGWAMEGATLRTTPYTEAELDALTEGTIRSIEDLPVWKNLVAKVGLQEATLIARTALQGRPFDNILEP